ncbi:uncharacterized protein K452DRAFT_298189 [Aplosporella prunicola CBS 121167]|uniref:Sodium/calcium exchanger membrane region domain-containing protein n=1 Tax=Aplosporella prunicola CBS 121167 TaxID=1176127 RepID=A0A6A6BG40_9PEZI|nr:uncharacterized protein K452DRAFT_298189 [Aplosporella prunicola CBS 121167]KAF2142204.1 hypothetical protein K452DRAFT_298189 [Aplosporella prunicola CBS 121167]
MTTPLPALRARNHARRPYSARPFVLTILLLSLISALALLAREPSNDPSPLGLHRRNLVPQHQEVDLECRLVHDAVDKCAFVRANCPDEEAGMFSYLQLYYCRLPHAKPVAFAIMVIWLGLLFSTIGIAASDFFCVNLSTISNLLGMSESLAGVTFLAFGNGSSDVFSTFAAMKAHSGSLAVGELIGAAGFITAVVAGSMALVRPFKVDKRSFVRDVAFFIVAATFSMIFLIDGKLYFWECAAMVLFYLFYVVFVVWWHWRHNRRQQKRLVEAAARAQYVVPGGEEAEVFSDYLDEDAPEALEQRPLLSRGTSTNDLATLERGDGDSDDVGFEETEEEVRDRWMGELNRNMRLSRPRLGERRHTKPHPIRPSLVGALEFRAVLSSLQKSRNIQTLPINLRRYSDDPNYTTAQQQDNMSTTSDPAARPPFNVPPGKDDATPTIERHAELDGRTGNRVRAVSANGADALKLDPSALKKGLPKMNLPPLLEDPIVLRPSPFLLEDPANLRPPRGHSRNNSGASVQSNNSMNVPSPTISLSPAVSPRGTTTRSQGISPMGSREHSPVLLPRMRAHSPELLAPPDPFMQQPMFAPELHQSPKGSPMISPRGSPNVKPQLPKLDIPHTGVQSAGSPLSIFSEYPWSVRSGSRPGSIILGPPTSPGGSLFPNEHLLDIDADDELRPLRWWPYKVLPPPRRLVSKLFPTLYSWHDKNIWEKILGIVAAPSVLLLTITLPVVDTDRESEEEEQEIPELNLPDAANPGFQIPSGPSTITITGPDETPTTMAASDGANPEIMNGIANHGNTAGMAVAAEERHRHAYHEQAAPIVLLSPSDNTTHNHFLTSPEQMAHTTAAPSLAEPKQWDRWLVILQAFTAPFFIVLIVWANTAPDNPFQLLRHALISLVCSLCALALILATTTPTRPPRWRPTLCFLGFAVSIAWISSIANEVVGVLKTIGVVLDISDAILGLTVFAVGNSLGDLVADITVARLGFPVMALSACFGGPMLNILLGIGLSGCYMAVVGAEHKHDKHPDRPWRFRPYTLEISSTLLLSGATLLITLAGLLVAVPARKWRMDRVVGWGLVGLWTVSTVGNLLAEMLGWEGPIGQALV